MHASHNFLIYHSKERNTIRVVAILNIPGNGTRALLLQIETLEFHNKSRQKFPLPY